MYVFELIYKYLTKKANYKPKQFDPLAEVEQEGDENCEHIFMPIDSTGEVLACSKCGLVVSKKKMKKKNIFKI